jgi:hypothetical protein
VERSGVGAAVWFLLRRHFLHDRHLAKVDHTDRVVPGIRGVELL